MLTAAFNTVNAKNIEKQHNCITSLFIRISYSFCDLSDLCKHIHFLISNYYIIQLYRKVSLRQSTDLRENPFKGLVDIENIKLLYAISIHAVLDRTNKSLQISFRDKILH